MWDKVVPKIYPWSRKGAILYADGARERRKKKYKDIYNKIYYMYLKILNSYKTQITKTC